MATQILASAVLYGPFNLVMSGGTGFSHSGLLPDSISIQIEEKKNSREIEDGREQHWSEGIKGTFEITFDDLVIADIALIKATTSFVATFTEQTIVLTVGAKVADVSTYQTFVDIADGSTKITVIKTTGIGRTIADLIAIS